jgi:hypothetical protein
LALSIVDIAVAVVVEALLPFDLIWFNQDRQMIMNMSACVCVRWSVWWLNVGD